MEVDVGLPCNNDALCQALGWGLVALAVMIVALFVRALWSEWRKHKK